MTRREKFRLALAPFFRTHPLHDHCEHEPQALSKWGRCSSFTELLNDLERACGPEPRREDLRAILKRWWNPPDEAEARIWAWATGATEPRWCEHWKHDGRFWEPMNQEGVTAVAQNHWRVCPLCATPRPAGA